jgi:hypothetical protein
MEGSTIDPAIRAARNQALFRSLNEKIEEVSESFRLVIEDADYVCECADDGCLERIKMTPEQYRAVRRVPTHFFVRRRHVFPEFERVVDERDGYLIVEKFGNAGAEAVALARERVLATTA